MQKLTVQHTIMVLLLISSFLAFVSPSAGHERTISSVELLDKLRGMWIGQLIGNAAGRATEGVYSGAEPNPAPSVPWVIKQAWDADDDTDMEYVTLHILESHGFDCDPAEIARQWLDHVTPAGIYIANRQAWYLMRDGYLPPETGSRHYNQHWYSIDAQIETELLGALSPGMPQTAIDLAGKFGRITNAGFAVHAAQFYAAMYAEAFFEPNIPALVLGALAALPADSRTREVVTDAFDWYQEDAVDGVLDWRSARARLYENYQGARSFGRYYNWVESTINTGATVLALLYGQGDFKQTVQIAVLAGWDCDCNPATAGGLLGIVRGFAGLPCDLTDPNACGDLYINTARPGLPDPLAALPQSDSILSIATRMSALAQENILLNSGRITTGRFADFCHIPRQTPTIEGNNQPVIGPSGLTARARAAGLTVTADACVARYDESKDRNNLNSIIDGVTHNSSNGIRPYWTYSPETPATPAEAWFQIRFSEPVILTGLTLFEGDIVWSHINTYYRDDRTLGGPIQDLRVTLITDGVSACPENIAFSDVTDPWTMYQSITITFTPALADGIRVTGTPAGHFATILEIEPHGELPTADHLSTPTQSRPRSR